MGKASFFALCIVCSLGRVEEQIDICKEGMPCRRELISKPIEGFRF